MSNRWIDRGLLSVAAALLVLALGAAWYTPDPNGHLTDPDFAFISGLRDCVRWEGRGFDSRTGWCNVRSYLHVEYLWRLEHGS